MSCLNSLSPPPLCQQVSAWGEKLWKMEVLFSSVPGNEVENEGRATTHPSHDRFCSHLLVWIQLQCMNLVGHLNRPTVCQSVSLPHAPLSPDLTWPRFTPRAKLTQSFIQTQSVQLNSLFMGDGSLNSFKPHFFSLILQWSQCFVVIIPLAMTVLLLEDLLAVLETSKDLISVV